jgi:hypothetical protein
LVSEIPGWERENRKPVFTVYLCSRASSAVWQMVVAVLAVLSLNGMILMVVRQAAALTLVVIQQVSMVLVVVSADFDGSGYCSADCRDIAGYLGEAMLFV